MVSKNQESLDSLKKSENLLKTLKSDFEHKLSSKKTKYNQKLTLLEHQYQTTLQERLHALDSDLKDKLCHTEQEKREIELKFTSLCQKVEMEQEESRQ